MRNLYLFVLLVVVIVTGVVFTGSLSHEGFETAHDTSGPETTKKQEEDQNRHIEEIREVLSKTVKEVDALEKDKNTRDAKTSLDEKQNKHIEELREVLSNTIRQLRNDDILPAGSACDCNEKPRINPETGEAEPANACRPPGWMRLMEHENRKSKMIPGCPCKNCPYDGKCPYAEA